MPLSQQLKSDMTSDRVAPTVESAPEKSAAEVSDDSEFELPITSESENADADTSTLPEKVVAVPATPAEPDILKSIAAQLETLNQNILALSKNVASKQEIDLRPVFARIDSARTSIEELIRVSVSQSAEPKEDNLQKALMMLQSVLEKQEKNDRQLVQTLRENATFQIQVRQGMQKDLDTLKKQLNGEQFEPLLKEIASVYVEYQPLLDDETISERSRKNLNQLFEQLEEILNDYGAETFRSEVGSVRKARVSKVIDKVLTGDEKSIIRLQSAESRAWFTTVLFCIPNLLMSLSTTRRLPHLSLRRTQKRKRQTKQLNQLRRTPLRWKQLPSRKTKLKLKTKY